MRLQHEHRDLSVGLRALVARARTGRGAPWRWETLVAETLELTNAFGRHELEENELIQEALMDDLGGGG